MTEHQRARQERAERRADHARTASADLWNSATKASDLIPMGQPILVGHHSEKRDRAFRAAFGAKMDKACALGREADRLDSAAARAGHAILSDDPEAVAALREKLASMERGHAMMVAANKCVKKKDRDGLLAVGFSAAKADELLSPDFCGRYGFPAYAIQNSNANIRRVRERITSLEAATASPVMEPIEGDGWRISEDRDDRRFLVEFDAKPDRATLDLLRTAGFKWSPSRGGHVRVATPNAVYAVRRVAEALRNA